MAPEQNANMIFLTEEEAERIKNTVKDRAQKCAGLVGSAREPRDLRGAISQATGAALMADMAAATISGGQGSHEDKVPALAVGQPYAPCIVPFRDLEPMTIADLKMETHHRGRRLTVKRAAPVVPQTARAWTMVQDMEGDEIERIELCLHKSRHGEDVLTSASTLVIKEPYFTVTDEGEATLRVDHPSDIIIFRKEIADGKPNLANGVNGDAENAAALEKKAKTCKDKGNAALSKPDLPLAHAQYTEGLKFARHEIVFNASPDLARDLHRNRAHVNLLLNQLDEAKSDAKSAMIGKEDERSKELDSKAYFRAGLAAYNLGDFEEAKGLFEERVKLMPNNKEANALLRRVQTRLREQETGEYDLKKLRAGLSKARPRADAASFIGNTTIKDSPGRGRGLFVTRDIPAGEVIMCEKSFCVVWGHEKEALIAMTYDVRDDRIRVSPVGLAASIVEKLISNPSQIERVTGLYGDYQGDGKNVLKTEDGPVVDTFRVHDIMSRNAFGPGAQYGEEGARNASTGLWIRAAHTNHSCVPNFKKEFVGDLIILRALRPIAAGEELLHSYDETPDYEARQKALMTTWGFECDCALCTAEKTDDPSVQKKRREMAEEADAFVRSEHWANAKRLTVMKAQRLAKAIDATYDDEKYNKDIPRLATRRIQEWLALASPRR